MYKYFFLLFFISLQLQSQINTQLLPNHWTKVKARMVDGSRDLTEFYPQLYQWRLINNKLCEDYNPLLLNSKNCSDYKIEKNFIKISPDLGYEIEKLDNDSLVVIQKIKGADTNDKLKKIWFIKSSVAKAEYISKTKNDSVLIATKYFTPSLSKNLPFEIISKFDSKGYYPNFEIKGNIVIFPKKKKIDFTIEEKDNNIKKNLKYIEIVKSIIESSYPSWALSYFMTFDKIYIPYWMRFHSKNGDQSSNKGIEIAYFGDDFKNLTFIKEIQRENPQLSKDNFNKGLEAFEKQKYDQAIEFFNKAHELDNTNIDSLYNIVAIYSSKNDLKNACIALKKLKDLEQTDGIKMFNEKCTNINP